METNKNYHPFKADEYDTLKAIADKITTHIPTELAGYVWESWLKINPKAGNKPCQCGSAAKYWKEAIDGIRTFITNVENG